MRIKQTAIALKTTIGAKETSMKDELLKQLHEQYAVNNNSSMGAIVSFIVGMFTAFGGYGYVWINTNFCPSGEKNYCFQDLTFVAIVVLFLLLIMSYICMYQGTSQRLEQFITHKIRGEYDVVDFFPNGYHPFKKQELDVVQGIYGELVKIFVFVSLLILISFYYKFYEFSINKFIAFYVPLVVWGIYLLFNVYFLLDSMYRYRKRWSKINKASIDKQKKYFDIEEHCPFCCCIMNCFYGIFECIKSGIEKWRK